MYAKVDLGGNGLGHIFTVRFIFSEIVMMATVLYYMFSILPCRRSKWKVVMIAYVSVFIYLFIMIATGKSFYGDGIYFRAILILTEQIVIPCYLIGDKTWYRYMGIAILGDAVASCLGGGFISLFYGLWNRSYSFDTVVIQDVMYTQEGKFYLLFIYLVFNFFAFFLVAKLVKKLMEKEKRKNIVLNVALILFVGATLMLNIIFLVSRHDGKYITSSNAITCVMFIAGLLCVVRGMIWEKNEAKKEQEIICFREKLQYERYMHIQSEQERVREIRHDLSDHMITVRLLLEKGDIKKAKEYVNKVKKR